MKSISVFLMLLMFLIGYVACDDKSSDSDSSSSVDDDGGPKHSYHMIREGDGEEPSYPESCVGGAVFPFDMDTVPMQVPYPNNLYTVADPDSITGIRVNIDKNLTLPLGKVASSPFFYYLIDGANQSNGFGTMSDLYIPLDAEPRYSTLPDYLDLGVYNSIFLMEAETSEEKEDTFIPFKARYDPHGYIALTPMVALKEKTRYVLVVTRNLEPLDSICYQASPGMQNVWLDYALDRGGHYDQVLAMLEDKGVNASQILALSEFATLWATKDLNDVRVLLDEMAEQSPPEMTDWHEIPLDVETLTGLATAKLKTPIFKNASGYWERNEDGELTVQSHEDLDVLFSLPAADMGPEGQPYPLVLWAHGLGATKESLIYIANYFAEQGFVLVGTDDICHGSRLEGFHDFYKATFCYLDLLDPVNARDNIRETIAGKMWLARAVKQLGEIDMIPEGGDGIPDFDVDHIYLLALSMGTMHGAILSGVEENIDAFVMSSAGAKFTSLIYEGPLLVLIDEFTEAWDAMFPEADSEEFMFLVGHLLQQIMDPAEAANYLCYANGNPLPGMEGHAPYILQQSAARDQQVGPNGQVYYVRAAGYPQLEPYIWDVGLVDHAPTPHKGSGFYQYNTDEHFLIWDGGILGHAYRKQASHFYHSHMETGVAEIINPFAD